MQGFSCNTSSVHLTATATAPPSSRFPRLKIKVITHRRHRRRLLKERAQRCLKDEARRFRRWGSGSADEVCMNRPHLITALQLQGWAKLPFLGCQNASGKMSMLHRKSFSTVNSESKVLSHTGPAALKADSHGGNAI